MAGARTGVWGVCVLAAVLVACGGGGSSGGGAGGGSNPPTQPPPPANRLPQFTSAAAASVAENTAGTFHTATATDADNDALTFTLSGGADRDSFRITSSGALSFAVPADFEAPVDGNRDNVYQLELSVSDGKGSVTQAFTVTVTNVSEGAFRVRRVATNLDRPVFLAPVPDGSGRVFVVELVGRIRILTPSTGATTSFLDIAGQIPVDGERGMLGFATAPDYATSGVFYVYVTANGGRLEVRRYRTFANDRNRADPASATVMLKAPHPFSYHNGGWIGFAPDGLFYVAMGDGGDEGIDNPQNRNVLLGKMLRVDLSRDDFPTDAERNYGIPASNPFAQGGGAPEVLAFGLRNPWRNSIDPVTGNLWIGDVGQGEVEEVDLLRPQDAGANFGWPIMEGTRAYHGGSTSGLTPPVAEYPHGSGNRQGNSITGGMVYRGRIEQLQGQYVFADFITPNIWTIPVSRLTQGTTLPASEFTIRNTDFAPDAGRFDNIVSFGHDQANNLYILDIDGEVFVLESTP